MGIQLSTPDQRTGPNSRRSLPCSSNDCSNFSPFTSAKAERLLGPRLAPEIKRILFAEAQINQSAAAAGNNSSLSASLLEEGRQVVGTEADASLGLQPAALGLQQSSPQSDAANLSSFTPGQGPSGAGNVDNSSSSNDQSPGPEGGNSGVAQGGSHFATPEMGTPSPGDLPGGWPGSKGRTPYVRYMETSTWTEDDSTFAPVTSLAGPEVSPREQHGSDGSPSRENNTEMIVEPPEEFRGPVLSLVSDSAASPLLVLRDVTSSSNSQSQPHYPSANPSPDSPNHTPERVVSSDCYANSSTTTNSFSDRHWKSRQRYSGDFTVDRNHRSNRMRNRRLRRSREVGPFLSLDNVIAFLCGTAKSMA